MVVIIPEGGFHAKQKDGADDFCLRAGERVGDSHRQFSLYVELQLTTSNNMQQVDYRQQATVHNGDSFPPFQYNMSFQIPATHHHNNNNTAQTTQHVSLSHYCEL